jgi:hypothetical protein
VNGASLGEILGLPSKLSGAHCLGWSTRDPTGFSTLSLSSFPLTAAAPSILLNDKLYTQRRSTDNLVNTVLLWSNSSDQTKIKEFIF